MHTPPRILIVDDHTVVRDGLNALLAAESGMKVVGSAANGAEAVKLAQALQPDVILLDLVMPELDGLPAPRLRTTRVLARIGPMRPVLIARFARRVPCSPSSKPSPCWASTIISTACPAA